MSSSSQLPEITSLAEVDDRRIERTLAPSRWTSETPPRQRAVALLNRMAQVAEPGQGPGRLLVVLARVAECDWLGGQLEVRLQSEGPLTTIQARVVGSAEPARLLPPLTMSVSLGELVEFVAAERDSVLPLEVVWDAPGVELRLRATTEHRPRQHASASSRAQGAARPTVRLEAVDVPKEALRPEPHHSPTVKIPAVRPADSGSSDNDDFDEGWD